MATARALGVTRAQLRGPRYLRLAHDLVVRLDDAIDEPERLKLIATVLPDDAAFSHGTAAALLGAPALGYARWRIALEYEGRQHAEADRFGRDIDRYSLMAASGWLVLRFANRHLGGPHHVVTRTRAAVISRGRRPGAD